MGSELLPVDCGTSSLTIIMLATVTLGAATGNAQTTPGDPKPCAARWRLG
jgi:hypothetical protein